MDLMLLDDDGLMVLPGEGAGEVQEEQDGADDDAAGQHGDGPKNPEEEGKRDVKGPKAQGPEEAPPVQAPPDVDRLHIDLVGGGGVGEQEADVGVVADRLDVAEEGEEEAEGDGEVLDGVGDAGGVAVDEAGGVGGGGGGADEDGDDGGEGDGGGGQDSRRHDVVAHSLHRQNAVLHRILPRGRMLTSQLLAKQATINNQ